MREIKFRAWLKRRKTKIMCKVTMIDFDLKRAYLVDTKRGIELGWYDFDEIELMQYTGLKDNNYDEIYEGDIVEILTEVEEYGVVKFEDGAFYVEADGFRVNFYDNIRGGDVLVIGNIYENKELLGNV